MLTAYPKDESALMSGYLLHPERIQGKAAALEVQYGKGRVYLLGFRPQWRGQSHGTYKFFFNAFYESQGLSKPGGAIQPPKGAKAERTKRAGSQSHRHSKQALHQGWTHFYATLQKGDSPDDYENALSEAVHFIEKNAAFWRDFTGGQGEVELILNHMLLNEPTQGTLCLQLQSIGKVSGCRKVLRRLSR